MDFGSKLSQLIFRKELDTTKSFSSKLKGCILSDGRIDQKGFVTEEITGDLQFARMMIEGFRAYGESGLLEFLLGGSATPFDLEISQDEFRSKALLRIDYENDKMAKSSTSALRILVKSTTIQAADRMHPDQLTLLKALSIKNIGNKVLFEISIPKTRAQEMLKPIVWFHTRNITQAYSQNIQRRENQEVKVNRQPLIDFADEVLNRTGEMDDPDKTKKLDLTQEFRIRKVTYLTKSGLPVDTLTRTYFKSGKEEIVKVMESGLGALLMNGSLKRLSNLGVGALDIDFTQSDQTISLEFDGQCESAEIASKGAGALLQIINAESERKNIDPRERVLLDSASVESLAERIQVKFEIEKSKGQEIFRSLWKSTD